MRRMLVVLILLFAPLQADGQTQLHRLAIVVEEVDEGKMIAALNIAISRARRHAQRGEAADIRIVAHGDGLHLLRTDTSPLIARLRFAAQSFPSISYLACATTAGAMGEREGGAPAILSQATRVPSGPVAIADLERDGWPIVRP